MLTLAPLPDLAWLQLEFNIQIYFSIYPVLPSSSGGCCIRHGASFHKLYVS